MKKSKQQVVRHLIKCRNIETTIKQSNMTNEAIRNHVTVQPVEMKNTNQNSVNMTIFNTSGRLGMSILFAISLLLPLDWYSSYSVLMCFLSCTILIRDIYSCGDNFALHVVDRDLKAIESIPSLLEPENTHPLATSTAFTLQRSLLDYDDDFLTNELENFPSCQVAAINIMLFSKIAWISSGKHISLSEAIDIYQRGDEMSLLQLEHLHLRGRITSDTDYGNGDRNVIRWKILKNMLRKKLRLQYLAVQLSKFEDTQSSVRSLTSRITDSGGRKRKTKSQKLMSKSLDFDSKYSLPELNTLSNQLEKSQERQLSLSNKINSNISLVSRSVPLGSLQAASNYSKKMGGKKMYNVLHFKVKGFWRIAFNKMRNHMRMYKYEIVCQHFLKSYAAHRYYYASCNAVQNKVRRRLSNWKIKLNNLRTLEEFAALIEIQRMVRGKISRIYVKNIHKHRAATQIQKYIRSYIAKCLVKRLKDHKRLKEAVLFIENCWKKNTWWRSLKNLFKLRKQTLASSFIQRVYYGHQGRKIARARRFVIAKHLGAIKMQCLWRRYQATLLVDLYYSRWKQVEGSIKIQKVARGIQGRRQVAIFRRRKYAAERIQRGYRCHQARNERLRRHLAKHSTRILQIMRGKLARDRVTQMRKRRAQEMAEHARAFGIVEKMILGHARRKVYIPKIAAYKEKRVHAAVKLKARLKAVKEGNAQRAILAMQRNSVQIIVRAIQGYLYQKYLRLECAIMIQSVVRRHLAKRIFREKQEEFLIQMSKQSLYYRLKRMFQTDQEAFFGNQAKIIQTYWRAYYANKVKTQMRVFLERTRAAEEIQRVGMNRVRRREANAIVKEKRRIKYRKEYAAIKIQKIGRGKSARNEYFKHQQANIMKFFLTEAKAISLTKNLFLNFKKRKVMLIRMHAGAARIQSLARGVDARQKVRKNYKRLVRNRDKMKLKKREKSAIKIQSIVRLKLAMRVIRLRQSAFAAQEEKRKQLEALDAKLDDLHETHLNDLLALRVQQGVRGNQARKNRKKQEEEIAHERVKKEQDVKDKAAAVLQGWARGMKGRRKFQELLPELRKMFRARAFCVECELAPATRKCRVCREQFCDVCFQNLHKKGTRKDHGFDFIRKADNELEETDVLGENNPLMWEEQWDENAQARYWYHSLTGEATWVNPFE